MFNCHSPNDKIIFALEQAEGLWFLNVILFFLWVGLCDATSPFLIQCVAVCVHLLETVIKDQPLQ